ncbi:MAG: DUF1444 family protein [Anaerolineae bacterium]
MGVQLLTIEQLAARIAARLQQTPGVATAKVGKGGVVAVTTRNAAGQRSFDLDVDPFYRAYVAEPQSLDQVVSLAAQQALTVPGSVAGVEQRAAISALLPQIKDEAFIRDAARQGQTLVSRPFADKLSVVYVADAPSIMRYITQADLRTQGWTAQNLDEVALENLRERANTTAFTQANQGMQTAFISATGDGYDAARILLPALHQVLAQRVWGRLLFGIPTRDILVVIGDGDAAYVKQVAARVRNDFESRPFPLSPHLYTMDQGQAHVYTA